MLIWMSKMLRKKLQLIKIGLFWAKLDTTRAINVVNFSNFGQSAVIKTISRFTQSHFFVTKIITYIEVFPHV